MARKIHRKAVQAQKVDGYLERFAYDMLKFTLLVCGLPEEKLKSKERNKNAYGDGDISNAGMSILNVALSGRDEWKSMFESRYKSSGFDTIEKIKDYLKSFFTISPQFRSCDTTTKLRVTLAAYSEMIMFLNYKDIEFDFEQLIILWRIHFLKLASKITSRKEASELLQDLIEINFSTTEYRTWLFSFVNYLAVPYGSKTDVSVAFHQRVGELKQIQDEATEDMMSDIAHYILQKPNVPDDGELDPVLPPAFESQAVLPGNRVSPEPPGYCSTETIRRKNKVVKRQSAKLRVGFEPLGALKDNGESTKPPEGCLTNSYIRRKQKRQSAELRVPPGFEPLGALKDNGESTKPPEGCSTNSNIRR